MSLRQEFICQYEPDAVAQSDTARIAGDVSPRNSNVLLQRLRIFAGDFSAQVTVALQFDEQFDGLKPDRPNDVQNFAINLIERGTLFNGLCDSIA